ncbi:hypothetical protein GMLC_18490 [Geomonas limicola]|uniref:Lipoprotein n=1 Tax=Geomonas limicola TaxID=2740186 RepID=A0A6V8N7D5_9BACT|nr:hypothetical protein [Geomonas limicola]GFO68270.1 hypothetical protein GMLC_18490 [Geomonas limicola]
MHLRRLTALLMICVYLILPLESFAGHGAPGSLAAPDATGVTIASNYHPFQDQVVSSPFEGAGDSHCPCSDRHDTEGCDSSCSCCSCCSYHAPLPLPLAWPAGNAERSCRLSDPFQFLPEVYLPIFVPPQNCA